MKIYLNELELVNNTPEGMSSLLANIIPFLSSSFASPKTLMKLVSSSYLYFSSTSICVLVAWAKNSILSLPKTVEAAKFSISIWRTLEAKLTMCGSSAQVWNKLPATLFATDSLDMLLNSEWWDIRNHVPNNMDANSCETLGRLLMILE